MFNEELLDVSWKLDIARLTCSVTNRQFALFMSHTSREPASIEVVIKSGFVIQCFSYRLAVL